MQAALNELFVEDIYKLCFEITASHKLDKPIEESDRKAFIYCTSLFRKSQKIATQAFINIARESRSNPKTS
jgi:hypothetical protein